MRGLLGWKVAQLQVKSTLLAVLLAAVTACNATTAACGSGCDDGDPCTLDSLTAHGDCSYRAWRGVCEDGNPCTVNELCTTGTCLGTAINCDDGHDCTLDACGALGCVHTAKDVTICDDANGCTSDNCDLDKGCIHTPHGEACDDGSVCTTGDACKDGLCVANYVGPNCDDKNGCTVDSCAPLTGQCVHVVVDNPCDDANPCTKDDVCTDAGCSGTLDCECAKAAGQSVPLAEDCSTPFDDNCDGKVNDESLCGVATYAFSNEPGCGAVCYYDEGHNAAINGAGQEKNAAGWDQFATGQLRDGLHGGDDWGADLGKGTAYEWVGWSLPAFKVTFKFTAPRQVKTLRIGVNNKNDGVAAPPEVGLRFSNDGKTWSKVQTYKLADNSLPAVTVGKRGDIVLTFTQHVATYVEIAFATPGTWTFVDEVAFE
jgi:hypothetical protein